MTLPPFVTRAALQAELDEKLNAASLDQRLSELTFDAIKIANSSVSGRALLTSPSVSNQRSLLGMTPDEDDIRLEVLGAGGRGQTDDTNAMLQAIAMSVATGRRIWLGSSSTYLLATWPTNGITLSGSLRMHSAGGRILGPVSGDAQMAIMTGEPDVFGVVFDRWGSTLSAPKAAGRAITGGQIANCTFRNIKGTPISADCPVGGWFQIAQNRFRNVLGTVLPGNSCVRIGTNVLADQDTWTDIALWGNDADGIATTGSVDNVAFLLYGRLMHLADNNVRNLTSVNGSIYAYYLKLRHFTASDCKGANLVASGTPPEVVMFNVKGNGRVLVAGSDSPQGYQGVLSGVVGRNIGGANGVGTGIKIQSAGEVLVLGGILEDCGKTYLDINDFGSLGSVVIGLVARSINYFATDGMLLNSSSPGAMVLACRIRDFLQSGCRVDGLPPSQGGAARRQKILACHFETVGLPGTVGVRLGSGEVTDLYIVDNTFDVSGACIANDSAINTNIRVMRNDMTGAKAKGAVMWSGPRTTGTVIRDNAGFPTVATARLTVPSGGTGLVWTHGLESAADITHVTPRNQAGVRVTWTEISPTQIRITHDFASTIEVSATAATLAANAA